MRPLDLLNINLNRAVTIQIKRNQRYVGVLAGFDDHLNMYLENVKNEIILVPEETEEILDDEDDIEEKKKAASLVVEVAGAPETAPAAAAPPAATEPVVVPAKPEIKEELIGNIILRGDNVIFLRIDKPIFVARQPQKPGYGRPRFDDRGGGPRRDYPPRDRDQRQGGYRPDQRGSNRPYPPRRDQGGQGGGRRDYPPRRDNRPPQRKPQGPPKPHGDK